MRSNQYQKILKLVEMAMLVALVVVLQTFGGFFKVGPFSLSLVLIPVVIGSIILDYKGGAFLGAVFGVVVIIQCAAGIDVGGNVLWSINPFLTSLICIVKGAAAGFFPGLIYKLLIKKSDSTVMMAVAPFVASISAPIANTGLFILGLSTCFNSTLIEWAGGTNVMVYIITGLVGINFIIEFAVNLVVSPAISTIINVITKQIFKK